ncbi:restriction endonuclease [Candidatus Bipolaricaulota bacterium]
MNEDFLYDLRPDEFEQLCAEILRARGFNSVQVVGGPTDRGIDIIAQAESQKIVVQVKHTKQISGTSLLRAIEKLKYGSPDAKHLIVITSAPLTDKQKLLLGNQQLNDVATQLLDRNDILATLKEHPYIEENLVAPARRRATTQSKLLWWSTLGVVASLLSGLLVSILPGFLADKNQTPLDLRIETVGNAIVGLRDLEQYLIDVQDDMMTTQLAIEEIQQEYELAQELEQVAETKLEAIKSLLRSRTWQDMALNYAIGFVLGIAASLTASVIFARWRQRRVLARE